MKLHTPRDLYFDQLGDIHSFTAMLIPSYGELSVKAVSPELRAILVEQGEATREARKSVQQIFSRHGHPIGVEVCKAMDGLIEGGHEHVERADDPKVRDLLLVAHFNRVLHYSMAAFSFAASLADCLEFSDDAAILNQLLQQEKDARDALAQSASNSFHPCMLESLAST
jgi:ferritin-like metal-binding protein YciE